MPATDWILVTGTKEIKNYQYNKKEKVQGRYQNPTGFTAKTAVG